MILSSDLIEQFVKAMNSNNNHRQNEATVYGTVIDDEGVKYVQLDGSNSLTPVSMTTNVDDGDRVAVMIKNHTAIITGNLTSPSVNGAYVDSQVKLINSDIEAINTTVKLHDSTIETLNSTVSTFDSRIKTVESDMETVNSTVKTYDSSITTMESDITTLKSEIKTVNTEMDTWNSDVEYIRSDITALDSSINAFQSDINAFRSDIQILDSKIDTYDSDILTINSNIETLSSTVSTQDSRIKTVESDVETLDSTVKTHDSSIKTLDSNISTLDSTVKTWDSTIKTCESTVNTLNSEVLTLNSDMETLDSTVSTFDSRIETVESDMETVNSTVSTYDSRIKTAESNIDTLNSKVTTHDSSISTLNSKVTTHDSSISTLSSDVAIFNSSFQITDDVVTGIKGINIEWITVETLEADHARIDVIESNYVKTEVLEANYITASAVDTKIANIQYADIGTADIDVAKIGTLFNAVGLIDRATIVDGHITGQLDAITVSANNITAGRLDAAVIEVINLNAANITVGTINGQQISAGTISLDNLASDVTDKFADTEEDIASAVADAKQALLDAADAQSTANSAKKSVYATFGGNGDTKLYFKIATLKIVGNYCNNPITISASSRGFGYSTVEIMFQNSSETDPGLNYIKQNGKGAWYIHKSDTGTWDLYYTKSEAWGYCEIVDYSKGTPDTRLTLTWNRTDVNADLPSGSTRATQMAGQATWCYNNNINYLDGGVIYANTVVADAIAAGAIVSDKIATDAITATKIKAGAISTDKIAANAITGDKIAANTITASSLAITDFSNYVDLNENTAEQYGFTVVQDDTESNNPWFQVKTLKRDTHLSLPIYDCYSGRKGDAYRIQFEVSSTAMASTANDGSTTPEYANVNIGFMCRKTDGTVTYPFPHGAKSDADGTVQVVDTTLTLSYDVTFSVCLQIVGFSSFSGTVKIRNVRVTRMTPGTSIMDGAITTGKIATGAITADKILAGSITTTELDTAQIFSDDAIIKQIFAQNITATGSITGATLYGAYADIDEGMIGGFLIDETQIINTYNDAVNGYSYTCVLNSDPDLVSFKYDKSFIALEVRKSSDTDPVNDSVGWFVTYDGYMYSESGKIGGLIITEDGLETSNEGLGWLGSNTVIGAGSHSAAGVLVHKKPVTVAGGKYSKYANFCQMAGGDIIQGQLGFKTGLVNAQTGTNAVITDTYLTISNGNIEAVSLETSGTVSTTKLIVNTGAETTHAMNLTGNIEYTMYGYTGIPLKAWGGNVNGCALTVGMGAATIVGAGESGRALESIINGTSEQLHLAADQAINFYSNCNNIEDRKHVVLDQFSNFYPDTTATTGYGSIGTSENKWAKGYIYSLVSSGITTASLNVTTGMEMYHPSGTPYIDFHHGAYGTETKDYTTRLIEEVSGTLKLYGSLGLTGNIIPSTANSSGIGSSSYPIGTIYSYNYYQRGKTLDNIYAVVSNGTKTTTGTGAWVSYTVSFGRTYASVPLISILPTTQFASENIRFVSFTGDSSNGFTGMTYQVYCGTSGFSYGTRWFAIGNIKI